MCIFRTRRGPFARNKFAGKKSDPLLSSASQGNSMDTNLKRIMAKVFEIEEEEITDDLSPDMVVLWDSLNHLKMITEIEHVFDVKLTMKEIRSMVTFARIREVVGSHVPGRRDDAGEAGREGLP